MTDKDKLMELVDAYAEVRHINGCWVYNIKTEAARQAVIEALSGVQALSAAPAGFVPVSAFDRLHAHAESLAARLLAAEQATPKAAPVSSDTLYLLRRLLSNQHTLTGPEFRAELEKIVGEAYQQEAQEPSHQETVDVVGVRSNGEHVNLGKIAMPPRMKAREIAIEQFGRFKDDDGSDAEMCFGALEYFLEWLIQQGWSKAPQPAPAPLSDDAKDAARYRWLRATTNFATNSQGERIDVRNQPEKWDAAIDAAIAAQGGKV